MVGDFSYDRLLQESLKGELKVVNAHLPLRQKTLSELLTEEYPHIICRDGSTHLFSRKELKYLCSLITPEEQTTLLLPIMIEVSAGQGIIAVVSTGDTVDKIISQVTDMPLTQKQGKINIYKPQLALIRTRLKTVTQYVFPPSL